MRETLDIIMWRKREELSVALVKSVFDTAQDRAKEVCVLV